MIWLITGGTKGIGLALRERVLEEGHTPVICSRGTSTLDNHFEINVGDPEQCEWLVRQVVRDHGRIDVLVNNAGLYFRDTIEDTCVADWDELIATNLDGTFFMCKYVLPEMKRQNYGRIINMWSYVTDFCPVERAAYSVSKAGVLTLTRTLREELEGSNVNAQLYSPVKTRTRMDLDNNGEKSPEETANDLFSAFLYSEERDLDFLWLTKSIDTWT